MSKNFTKIYNFHGKKYSTCIDEDFITIHQHGKGRDMTNQQPCCTVLSHGTWMVCWTQASYEAAKDESVVGAGRYEYGKTWSNPFYIEEAKDERTASWGMLFLVPHTQRVYCLYWWNENAYWLRDAGTIYFRFTEDEGKTWSDRYRIQLPRHEKNGLDIPGEEQHGWNTGFPILTPDGAMLLGFTKISPPSMVCEKPGHHYGDPDLWHTEVFFLRCTNILTEDDPSKLEFIVTPEGDSGLWAPHTDEPERRFCQEPYMAVLPSGRIIATMRTRTGHPYYSISEDYGITWRKAEPFRIRPAGEKLKHPCGPCPITTTRDGRVLFFYRNDNTPVLGWTDRPCYWTNRDPFYISVGREMPKFAQRFCSEEDNACIYFDAPKIILSGVEANPSEHPNIAKNYPRRHAQYPHFFQCADRFFVVYSNHKIDIRLKEIPIEMFAGYGLPIT